MKKLADTYNEIKDGYRNKKRAYSNYRKSSKKAFAISTIAELSLGTAAFAALKYSPLYFTSMAKVATVVVAGGPYVVAGAGAVLGGMTIAWGMSGKAYEKKYDKELDLFEMFLKGCDGLIKLTTLCFEAIKSVFKSDNKVANNNQEPIKPVVKAKPKKKKVQFEPLEEFEINDFKMRMKKILNADTQHLVGKKKKHLEDFQESMYDIDYSLDKQTLKELSKKNGIIKAVRVVNKLKCTQDVEGLAVSKSKMKELIELAEAVDNRKARKEMLINMQDKLNSYDIELAEANNKGLTLVELRNNKANANTIEIEPTVRTKKPNKAKEIEYTKNADGKTVKNQSKATRKPTPTNHK